MRLADYVIQRLEEAGIDHAFTVCGGGSIFLNDALAKAKRMRYVSVHHEQAASIAAEAYARVRSGYGLAIVTSGPGGTNAITGVTGAWTDHVPTITISGQVFSTQMSDRVPGLRTLGVQEINIVDIVKPITKYAVCVKDPQMIRYHLEYALYLAKNDRPGPVWIDIPADVQNADINPDLLKGFSSTSSVVRKPDNADIQKVIELLKQAKRPLLHIGQGIRIADAIGHLHWVIDLLQIPVVTARNGADIIDSDHPLYVGRPGTFAQRGANFAVQTCDLYIAVGTRLSLAQTGYNAKDYARNATVVMVDVDRAELDKKTVKVDLGIQADAKAFLNALLRMTFKKELPDWSDWLSRCKNWQEKYPPVTQEMRDQEDCVNSYALIEALSRSAKSGDIIVTDVGFAFQNAHQAWKIKSGQRLLSNNGLAPMGWGLPAAIGAAVGSGRRVILLVGDGGMMMNIQELSTLAHHKLPVKIFLFNNAGYLTMRQSQAHAFDGYMGSDEQSGISFPSFIDVSMGFGIDGMLSFSNDAAIASIASMFQHGEPQICEVMMDSNQDTIPKSINRRIDGKIVQTAIEDAWPFLPREEMENNLSLK